MFEGSAFGRWRRRVKSNEVQFAAVQQFPLDVISWVEANGRR